jgi:hypothetical protein
MTITLATNIAANAAPRTQVEMPSNFRLLSRSAANSHDRSDFFMPNPLLGIGPFDPTKFRSGLRFAAPGEILHQLIRLGLRNRPRKSQK